MPSATRFSASSAVRNFPWIWAFADSLFLQLAMVVLVPGLLALVFGWLAFRSRVTGVYLSILTQAMTLALSLYLFQNDSGLRGNNGLSGLQNIPGFEAAPQATISIVFFLASAVALALGYVFFAWVVSGKMGSVIKGIRDNEARVRFLGYHVESYKLFVFTITAIVSGIAGALYYPQAGIINPGEIAPIASIYLAVWVAIGGRGRLYGAVIGAAFVSLLSSWFTGGGAPTINLGFLHDPVDRLVAGPAGPVLCRRHAVLSQGHRRAFRLPGQETVMTTLLEVSGVSVTFDGFRAINNLSVQFAEAELRAIIGPNGAGKTTFMDIVTGKTKPDEGHVIWGEKNISLLGLSAKARSRWKASDASSRNQPCSRTRQCVENLAMALKTAARAVRRAVPQEDRQERRADRRNRRRDRAGRQPDPHRGRTEPRTKTMAGNRHAAWPRTRACCWSMNLRRA